MPNPVTYGELKRDIDGLLDLIARLHGRLAENAERLRNLRTEIVAEDDAKRLDGVHRKQAEGIDRTTAALEPAVVPQEEWPC